MNRVVLSLYLCLSLFAFEITANQKQDEAKAILIEGSGTYSSCLLYTSPSPRDVEESRMPSSA